MVAVRGDADTPGAARGAVVVGVDGSPAREAAFAFEAAAQRGARLVAVHMWRDPLVNSAMAPLLDFDVIEDGEREVLAEWLAGVGRAELLGTYRCGASSFAIAPPARSCRSPLARNSWWSARAAAAAWPGCCSAR